MPHTFCHENLVMTASDQGSHSVISNKPGLLMKRTTHLSTKKNQKCKKTHECKNKAKRLLKY